MEREIRKKDIAIIGISGRFHGSKNVDEFWKNLVDGKELMYAYSEEELLEFGINRSTIDNPNYVPVESIVDNADSFDYSFFGYTKDEASVMDPQIRILHEQVWLALEDAGCNPFDYPEKIGLYLSASDNFNWVAHAAVKSPKSVNPFFLSQISNKDFISTLISYSLNLKGPSYFTATACSSSLTSIHLACRSLLMRECSIALAGGVSLDTSQSKGYIYNEGMVASKDGHCKAFDSMSSGCMKGNGGAVITLKRMEDAIRDNDQVYAVIRSTAANNDGRRKVGYTAPSVSGQAECIKLTHKVANIPYHSISYIEAHGTGTKLGDPIEIEALNKAFNNDTSHRCAIGSVKTNVGHLDAAAGVTGVVKTALALQHKKLPASLHFKQANPEISFDGGPFYVNAEVKDWTQESDVPLRAGVSSFGIGGTNVHLVLEEHITVPNESASRPFQLMLFSAKNKPALDQYDRQFQEFLKQNKTVNLADLAYTLTTGRAFFKYRNFAVYPHNSHEEFSGETQIPNPTAVAKKKQQVIFMFPGQGNQYFQMAKEIYLGESVIKSEMDKGFEILSSITGESYEKVLGYIEDENIDETLINNTYYTQPILFLVEYALAKYLMHLGIQPNQMIGHSLGEYTAACLAEVFSLEDTLDILVKRAQLMQEIPSGKMLAVGISKKELSNISNNSIAIAAVNTNTSCVVSGEEPAIKKFMEVLKGKDIPFSELKTSHAFHSSMMDPMLLKYEEVLNKVSLSVPKFPFISNLTGKPILDKEATSPKYWVRHLRETVKFSEGMEHLQKNTDALFVEVGPGRSLMSFSKQISGSNECMVIGLMRHPKEQINDHYYLTMALGNLWSQGLNINWKAYYAEETRQKISAPTYCFNHHSLDYKVNIAENLANMGLLNNGVKPYAEWFYRSNWKAAVLPKDESIRVYNTYLVFSDQKTLSNQLISRLKEEGHVVVEVIKGDQFEIYDNFQLAVNAEERTNFLKVFEYLKEQDIECNNILFNWPLNGDDYKEIFAGFNILLDICKGVIGYFPDTKKKLSMVGDFNYEIIGNEKVNILADTVKTVFSICAQENNHLFAQSIDIGNESMDEALVTKIKEELAYNLKDASISYRHHKRWVNFYENIEMDVYSKPVPIDADKTYLITGGLGFLGNVLAYHLAKTHHAKVILTGRTELPASNLWEDILQSKDSDAGLKTKIQRLQKLQKVSDNVHYYAMDVSEYKSVETTVDAIILEHGNISGVVHAAGNIDNQTFKFIESVDNKSVEQQFAPKIKGTLNIYKKFKDLELDFVWISSSLASVLGGLSYGAYAAANRFIDAFIDHHKLELNQWMCLNFDGLGTGVIEEKDIIDIFDKTLSKQEYHQFIVSRKDPNAVLLHSIQKEEEAPKETVRVEVDTPFNYVAPSTNTEETLSEIWQSFFGYDKISVVEDFFELGGDSLKAMTIIKRIQTFYGVEINLLDFFSKPTIQQIAEEIDIAKKLVNAVNKGERTNVIKI